MATLDDLYESARRAPAPAASTPALSGVDALYDVAKNPNAKPNLMLGIDAIPDQEAERQRLASRYGLPRMVIDQMQEDYAKRAKLEDANKAMEGAPALRSWLAGDAGRARIAHDDVGNLSAIERVWRTGKAYAGATTEGLVGQTLGGTLAGLSEGFDLAARSLRGTVAPLLPAGLVDFMDQTTLPEWMDPKRQFLAKPGSALKNLGRLAAPDQQDTSFGTDVAKGIGQVGGQIAAALLTGGASSAVMLGAQGVDQMTEKVAQDNATQAKKDVAVALGAGWTAVTEKYGLDRLLNRVPPAVKNAALRKIADVAAGAGIEAAQEVAEGIGQDVIRRLLTDPDAQIGAGIANEASVAGAVGGIVRAALGVRTRGARIQQANDQAEAMGEIDKLAAKSKLRERSPETFASFMQQVQQDGPIRDVYVDARDLSEDALRQLVEASPAASQQVAQSLATGLDMQIPVSEFGANVAGQDWAKAVIPHLKTDPNGLSKAQADEAGKTKDADAVAGLDAALTGEEAANTFAQSRAAVEARVLEQSIATGRLTPDAHKPYAALTAARYAALASRLGITPEQALERYPLNIAAETPAGEDFEQPAYHGSPHRGIEQFTTKAMGTGEGAQAYGWGLYFAQSKDIAEFYRRTLTAKSGPANDVANHYLNQAGGDRAKALAAYDAFAAEAGLTASDTADIREILSSEPGQLYEVEVPDDIDMLDYDASLKDQPEKVRKALEGLGFPAEQYRVPLDNGASAGLWNTLGEARKALAKAGSSGRIVSQPNTITGAKIYSSLQMRLGSDEAASRALFAAGIPGLRYLDAGSRGAQANNTTRNYVIFDDSAARKTGEFYQGQQPVGASGPQQPVVRGTYTPEAKTIALLKDANFSTFVHESGHLYLDQTAQIAAEADAPPQIVADMQTLLDWFGVKGEEGASALEVWNRMTVDQQREHHEKFARGFEQYAMEDKAPSHALAGAFQRFRGWLRRLYQSAAALNVQLTDEVRQVMDRMISTEAEIAEAKAAQSMGLMFNESDAAKLGIDYRAYQAQDADVTGQAEQELDQRRIADLKWFEGAKSAALKDMQRQAAEKRREVKTEARSIVMAQPVYRAWAFLTGRTQAVVPGVTEIDTTEHSGKLRTSALVEMFGEDGAWTKLRDLRMVAEKNGMHPDIVAEQFGYDSGEALVDALRMAQKPADAIEVMADAMMLERYGDITSREALEQAALEAVTNRARTRVIATELNALETAAKTTKRTVTKAAEAFAAQVVGRQAVGELRPEKFEAAARKAAAASLKAFKAGDIKKAATEKRNELVNTYAARAARDAQKQIDKKLALFKRATQKPIAEVAKTRDADMVQAMRAILAEYGIGTEGEPAQKYLDALKSHDPDSYTRMAEAVATLTAGAQDYRKISVDDFRALADELDVWWALAKRNRQMIIEGDLIDVQEAEEAVNGALESEGVPLRIPGEGHAVTEGEKLMATLRSARAGLRRVESWVTARDGGMQGTFRKYIWNPINDGAVKYKQAQLQYRKRYLELLSRLDLGQARIEAPELGYTFGRSKGGSGKQEILHALLHTGNESNKRKLLLGRHWATLNEDGSLDTSQWDAFLRRMHDQGVITKADWDFVQGVWDLLEETKVGAQQTHRQVFGRSFDEIVAEEVQTPFGAYRGGYVPAMADPDAVSDAKTRGILEEENQTMAHAFPSAARGFTKNRVEYNRPLLLDLRSLAAHLDKVLMFTHMEVPVRDVRRLLSAEGVRTPLSRIDSSVYDGMLIPWLNRAARQQTETPVPAYNGLFRYLSVMRARVGMAAMFANVSNAAQQVTGFGLAAVRVGPAKLAGAMASYIANPRKMAERVAAASPYMESRLKNEIGLMNSAMDEILLNPSILNQAQAWTSKHAYFLQAAVDNVMGPVIWTGAYNQAIDRGASEVDARREADAVIRETQGGNRPEDIAAFEAGTPFVRLFTQFQGYFNMQANLLGTELFGAQQKQLGLRQRAGRGLYVFTMGFLAPALVATLIAQAMRGGPDDEDGDGWYLDDWMQSLGIGVARNATAMVPFAGQFASVGIGQMTNTPTDDRASLSPVVSALEAFVRAPYTAYKAAVEEGAASKAARDVATLLSLTIGVPASAAAKPIAYASDVAQGRVEPTGPVDAIRGAISGAASPESKR